MIYVALLRGINVGGNKKVEMSKLKAVFEVLGFNNVITYINSGNVVFSDTPNNSVNLHKIEKKLETHFGFKIDVILRDAQNIKESAKAIPQSWVNDSSMKCDVMFLKENFDNSDVIKQFIVNPKFEDIKYIPGAIIWRINRDYITKSAMLKLVGTQLYKNMTIRNCNTVRKLSKIVHAMETD